MSLIKSPLRYPGGKSRAINQIMAHAPLHFSEYREPFVGGGSVFIYLRQLYPKLDIWINDLNAELYHFWQSAKQENERLAAEVLAIKQQTADGRALFKQYMTEAERTDFERAARFFVLNRISFSGTVEAGGYSQSAFEKRFTLSSIERLKPLPHILAQVKITNLDYREVLNDPGDDVFIFLDPPYYSATHSRLYGKRGRLHTGFDHTAFAEALRACPHRWLITYDDSPEIRDNFSFAHIYEWELQYGMNNINGKSPTRGKELFILNYRKNEVLP